MHFTLNTHPVLSRLVHARRYDLKRLADAWHAAGADSFGIGSARHPIAFWHHNGDDSGAAEPSLTAPLLLGGRELGQLFVSGIDGAVHQTRLEADAAMVELLLMTEQDLDSLTAELVQSQDHLIALYDLTHVSHGDLGVQAIISTVVQAAARLLQAEAAFCVLDVSPPVIMQHPAACCDETLLVGYLLQVQARQTRLLHTDMPGDIRDLLVVPVPIHGESLAVLGIINHAGGFKSPHIRLLEALAELTGSKVEHAQLYETTLAQEKINTEMELARRVQELLLPQKQPVVNGLDVYGVTLPAFQVGGDFYDWLQSPEAFTFMVGDVAGKGVAGAMMMVMSRSALRGTAQLGFALMTPEDILAQTCERVYDDFTQVSTFTTVFVGQYDYLHQRIIYANAGHAPVIFCRAGEQARLLEADAPALGVLRGSLSENHVQPMHPGDVLVVATDGYNEAENPAGEQFGYERLLHLVELHRDKSARDLVLHLEDALRDFEDGAKRYDDRTILVIKRVVRPVEGGYD